MTRRGAPPCAPFPCFRCATSSSSRTWSCRCSSVARSRSTRSKRRWPATSELLLAAQTQAKTNDPTREDIFAIGTIGTIIQLLRLPDGTVKVLVEGKRARAHHALRRRPSRSSWCEVEDVDEPRRRRRRGRGADALGAGDVRELRQAQQAHPARDARCSVQHDRRPGAARRHDRRAPRRSSSNDKQELLETPIAGEAPRDALRADAGRDRDSPGREEDPHARQEADGEDAEGVLPQRADAGDPEGARRARRVQERAQELEEKIKHEEDEQGGAGARSRRSSRSSR